MIRNIVFDMGQVLIRWKPADMLDALPLTAQERQLLLEELFQNVEWVMQDRGALKEAETLALVAPRLPEHLHPMAEELVFWFRWHLIPMPGMAELVRELKEQGYGLYLLSNASTALRGYFPGIPGSECFDGIVVSGEEKVMKPLAKIYETLFDRFDLKAEECLFIDDAPANIDGAAVCGMQGILFRGDVKRLRRELRSRGITVSE